MKTISNLILLLVILSFINCTGYSQDPGSIDSNSKLKFINTSFENASPLDWEVDSTGAINISMIYDHQRSSPNQANGHWHFQIEAEPGADLTLTLNNFDNVWNGKKASPVTDKTNCLISKDGIHWDIIPTELINGNRLRFIVHMNTDKLFVASVEPYRISDLDKLLSEIH